MLLYTTWLATSYKMYDNSEWNIFNSIPYFLLVITVSGNDQSKLQEKSLYRTVINWHMSVYNLHLPAEHMVQVHDT